MFNDISRRVGNVWNSIKSNYTNSVAPTVQSVLNTTQNFAAPQAQAQAGTPAVNIGAALGSGGLTPGVQSAPSGLIPTANAQTLPGNPQMAAAQQQADMAKYFPSFADTHAQTVQQGIAALNNGTPPTSISPMNFSLNSNNGTYPSSSANGNMSINDAMNVRNQYHTDLMNGTAPSNFAPSDNNYQNVISQIYNASLYTPQEQEALGNYNQTQGQILSTQLAARRQIKDLQERGQITKEQGASFLSETQRRADAQLADLSTQQAGNTLSLQTLGMLRQNQLGALQNVAGFMKPTEVSPGSTLVNPVTGQPTYQGMGAAPATILQSAMSLWTQAQQSGTATYNSDGTPDIQPFLAQAQQYYGGGGMNTYGQGGQGGMPAGQAQNQMGQMPPQLATYLQASGGQIINEDKVPKTQQDTIKMLAAQNGVPYLTAGDLDKFQSINVTQENLKNMEQVSEKILSSGLGGRTVGALWNNISGALQLNPDISSFKAWRDTAVNTIQALAGGQGSGFRLNQAEINLAANNLPTINDNLETAHAKMAIVNSMLDRWKSQLLTGKPTAAGASTSNNSQWNW